LAKAKGLVALHVSPEAYNEIRDILGDCQELLAVHCDTAPIRLIAGRVDEIVENLTWSKKFESVGALEKETQT